MSVGAEAFLAALAGGGVRLLSGVPCSLLGSLFAAATRSSAVRYIPAPNEGEALALACGAALGGTPAGVLLQNSGLGNTVNPLVSLSHVAAIPSLLVIGWRGEPGQPDDEPQHRHMGAITAELLRAMGVMTQRLPNQEAAALDMAAAAAKTVAARGQSQALLVSRGTFSADKMHGAHASADRPERLSFLRALHAATGDNDVLVTTTGYTSRELEALGDRANQLYVVGAMGCASSAALGLALSRPRQRVIVLDGDGAALMRLSAFAMIGAQRPTNLVHVVFDNGAYESTGAQPSAAPRVAFTDVARACGYPQAATLHTPSELLSFIDQAPRPALAHVPVRLTAAAPASRPALSPADVAGRLRQHLGALSA